MVPKDKFLSRLAVLAQLCPGFVLSKEIIAIYDLELATLGYERASLAIETIIKTRRARDPFPSIADIRDVIEPKIDPRLQAADVASRIMSAVPKFGSGRYQSEEGLKELHRKIQDHVGDLGWEAIKVMGGWFRVCEQMEDTDTGTFRAQLREIIESTYRRAEAGLLNQVPSLPSPRGKIGEPKQLGSVLQALLPNGLKSVEGGK